MDKIATVVGTISNDERLIEVPKMTVCALKFTAAARARIEKAGGRCMTFDQLMLENPKGNNCILLQGKRSRREVVKHFGAAGMPNSHTKAKGQTEGRRGIRRNSW